MSQVRGRWRALGWLLAVVALALSLCAVARAAPPSDVAGGGLPPLLVRALRLALVLAVACLGAWLLRRLARRASVLMQGDHAGPADWDAALLATLLRRGQASLDDLPTLPERDRPLAMRRFLAAHPELSLTGEGTPPRIAPQRADLFAALARQWDAWLGAKGAPEAGPAAARLVEQLCGLLGLAPIESRAYGAAHGYMVSAPPLRLSLPARFPILLVAEPDLTAQGLRDAHDLARALGATSFFAVLLTPAPRAAALTQIRTLRREPDLAAHSPVVLDRADLAHLCLAKDPLGLFVQMILAQVDLPSVSPYVAAGPVPESMFFGREQEVADILHTIRESSHIIVGARKMGKSSLLAQLGRLMEATEGLAPVRLDCQHVTSYAGFFDALEMGLQVQLPSREPEGLHTAALHWRQRQPNTCVVLLLDEVDHLVQYDQSQGMRLFDVLRALDRQRAWRCVLCGERVLYRAVHDPTLPLAGLGQLTRLGPLRPQAVRRMVEAPMAALGVTLADGSQLVRDLVALSAGRPDVVQAACQMMIARAHARGERALALADLAAVRQSDEFREFYLDAVWGNASTLERLITVLMAEQERFDAPAVAAALAQAERPMTLRLVRESLDTLELYAILEREGSAYRFAATALPQMLIEAGLLAGLRQGLVDSLPSKGV